LKNIQQGKDFESEGVAHGSEGGEDEQNFLQEVPAQSGSRVRQLR
jgi:hypothetical protein